MNEGPLYPEGDPSYATKLPPLQLFTTINGDYFRAMGIPILAGRTFERMEVSCLVRESRDPSEEAGPCATH